MKSLRHRPNLLIERREHYANSVLGQGSDARRLIRSR